MNDPLIRACHVCDDEGLLPSRRPCNHSPAVAAARRGAARAAANIRPTITPAARTQEDA